MELRKTGLTFLGDMPWGTHTCHFYGTQRDFMDTLAPFFQIGLENKEFCLWVVPGPMTEPQAKRALRSRLRETDHYLAERRLQIVSSDAWYLAGGSFSMKRVLRAWDRRLDEALAKGYVGMRANGNTAWLDKKDWRRFIEYERALDAALAQKPIIVMCSYPLATSGAAEILDVARTHQFAIARRHGTWEAVEWRPPPTEPDRYATLTTREREVLLLAAEGHPNPAIARRLSIGVRTVETHRANLMRKLGLRNQTDVVRYALRRGLLPLSQRSQ